MHEYRSSSDSTAIPSPAGHGMKCTSICTIEESERGEAQD